MAEETRGWVPAAVLSDQPEFSDWPDLMQQMAERPEAQRCFAQHWLSFAAGNREPLFRLGAPVAQPVLERVTQAFSEENLSLRELIVAVALEVARGGVAAE